MSASPSLTTLLAAQRLRWNAFGFIFWWLIVRSDLWATLIRIANSMVGWRRSSWDTYLARIGYIIFLLNIAQAVYTLRPWSGTGVSSPSSELRVDGRVSTHLPNKADSSQSEGPSFPQTLTTQSLRARVARKPQAEGEQANGGNSNLVRTDSSPSQGVSLPLSRILETPVKGYSVRDRLRFMNESDKLSLQTLPAWSGTASRGATTIDSNGSTLAKQDEFHSTNTTTASPASGRRVLKAHEAHNTGLDPLAVSVYQARKSFSETASQYQSGAFDGGLRYGGA